MFKKTFFVSTLLTSTLMLSGCGQPSQTQQGDAEVATDSAAQTELETLEQRISYAIGADLAQNLQQNQVPVDAEVLTQAFQEVFNGAEPRMTREQMVQANREMAMQLQQQAQELQAQQAEKNQAAGETFLDANATKEGVTTTDSGLQYKVVTEGEGPKPTAEDTVTVHYRGTLIDGTEFDSSYSRGEPASFPLGSVIKGWTEGLQLMNEGSKYEFYIPSDLAYGPGGRPPTIPPSATLVFEVELLKAKQEVTE